MGRIPDGKLLGRKANENRPESCRNVTLIVDEFAIVQSVVTWAGAPVLPEAVPAVKGGEPAMKFKIDSTTKRHV